jgi:hypothetical protein
VPTIRETTGAVARTARHFRQRVFNDAHPSLLPRDHRVAADAAVATAMSPPTGTPAMPADLDDLAALNILAMGLPINSDAACSERHARWRTTASVARSLRHRPEQHGGKMDPC